MKHADFLRYLNGTLAATLQDEIAYMTISVLSRPKRELKSPEKLNKEVFRYLDQRWSEALKRDMVKLVAALVLHAFGWFDKRFMAEAFKIAERLQGDLAEGFERAMPKLKKLLGTKPKAPTRRPPYPKNPTQYRVGDVIAFRVSGHWYPAHVYEIMRDGAGSEFVGVEFYDLKLKKPEWHKSYAAKGGKGSVYNDGVARRELFLISGLTRNPDPAGQIAHLASAVKSSPAADKLAPPVAGGALTSLHRVYDTIQQLFGLKK